MVQIQVQIAPVAKQSLATIGILRFGFVSVSGHKEYPTAPEKYNFRTKTDNEKMVNSFRPRFYRVKTRLGNLRNRTKTGQKPEFF